MSWTCPECGSENSDESARCFCGFEPPEPVMEGADSDAAPTSEPNYPPMAWYTDTFAWVYLALLLAHACGSPVMIVNNIDTLWLWPLYLVPLTVLVGIETRKANRLGISLPTGLLLVCVPVYAWRRLSALKQPRHHFWIWMAVFLCSIFASGYTAYSVQQDKIIKETVHGMVTDAFQKADVKQPFRLWLRHDRGGDYTGVVTLEDGTVYPIHAQKIEDKVFVQFK